MYVFIFIWFASVNEWSEIGEFLGNFYNKKIKKIIAENANCCCFQ